MPACAPTRRPPTRSRPRPPRWPYRAHASTIARWAAHLGGRRLDVEDAVHEVFLVVGKRLGEFAGTRRLRRGSTASRSASSAAGDAAIASALAHLRAPQRRQQSLSPRHLRPSNELEQRQSRETVYRILERLAGEIPRVLVLFELEEMWGKEISALTGIKLATVWVSLHRARAQFLAEMNRDDGGR